MKKVAFDELKKDMKTGDIMLFNGQYTGSLFIELLERSQWSHVGIIVKFENNEEPFIWEATSLTNVQDVIFEDNVPGVKLVSLRDRMSHYGDELKKYKNANFGYRKMIMDRPDDLNDKIVALHRKYHGIEDPSFWEMIWDAIQGRFLRHSVPLTKFFCSEFVAEMFLNLEWINEKKPINAYIPSDFSEKGAKHLHLLKGQLEPEVEVDIQHI